MEGSAEDESRNAWRRMLSNFGWLLGGKGFGAVSSLIYLAILSRSLGVKDFGHFALIFVLSQAAVMLAGFQTWQAIVKLGTPHLVRGDREAFARLSLLGGAVDLAASIAGCVLVASVILLFGEALELNPAYDMIALAFICAMLLTRVSAPFGIIRAFDRFELSVWIGAITPTGRLLAAIAIWLTGPSVGRFLTAWALVELVTITIMWGAAWRLGAGSFRLGRLREWRQTVAENEGITGFLWVTYWNTALQAVVQQGPLLAVGYLFGTSAAGIYRIADQLAKGLSKFAVLISDAVYPEVNRQRHVAGPRDFRLMVRRVTLAVLPMSVAMTVLTMLLGSDLLTLISGPNFEAGGPILVPLVIAASLEIASVVYEPVLHSVSKAHYLLIARIASIALLAAAILGTAQSPLGVGWLVAYVQMFEYLVLSWLVVRVLRGLLKPATEPGA
ncbi:MAG: lipopolysaccharide biosynthesis protein [Porphyrobacter sp.]|jgi:O-antigen/teichoic acid export membrane protein|nr:lipopolysaccharide biosynthesis protein [Porphyrobacter sp.]